MKIFFLLTKRNIKLFFKDKVMFLTSLIAPLILLVLYTLFLQRVYRDSFVAILPEGVSKKVLNGAIGAQLLSSLLAVTCVTVAFCSNMLMVQDKVTGARKDIDVSPVQQSTVALAYYVASVVSTLIVCLVAYLGGLLYVAASGGWCFRFTDLLLILLDVVILVLFGTAFSSVVHFFLSSQGQISAVGTVVSAGYGFICGAYMPLSQFSKGLATLFCFLPGTYGTSLVRNHCFNGVFIEMGKTAETAAYVDGIRDAFDCNLYIFGHGVPQFASWLVILGSTALLIGLYILQNVLRIRRINRSTAA